jgi:hypothetical protein
VLRPSGSRISADGSQLVEDEEAVLLVADDDGRGHGQRRAVGAVVRRGLAQRRQTLRRLLQQARVAVQHEELLGVARARQRPQPGAGAAGHDDGLDGQGGGRHGAASTVVALAGIVGPLRPRLSSEDPGPCPGLPRPGSQRQARRA